LFSASSIKNGEEVTEKTVAEFLAQTEQSLKVTGWSGKNQVNINTAKLCREAHHSKLDDTI
jgi:hypothetical protein